MSNYSFRVVDCESQQQDAQCFITDSVMANGDNVCWECYDKG